MGDSKNIPDKTPGNPNALKSGQLYVKIGKTVIAQGTAATVACIGTMLTVLMILLMLLYRQL